MINEILKKREERQLRGGPGRYDSFHTRDIGISTIGSYSFLEFTRVYGGDDARNK